METYVFQFLVYVKYNGFLNRVVLLSKIYKTQVKINLGIISEKLNKKSRSAPATGLSSAAAADQSSGCVEFFGRSFAWPHRISAMNQIEFGRTTSPLQETLINNLLTSSATVARVLMDARRDADLFRFGLIRI